MNRESCCARGRAHSGIILKTLLTIATASLAGTQIRYMSYGGTFVFFIGFTNAIAINPKSCCFVPIGHAVDFGMEQWTG